MLKKHTDETRKKMSEIKKESILSGNNTQVKPVRVFYKGELFGEFKCMRYAGNAVHEFFIKNNIPSTNRSAEEGIKRILNGYKTSRGKYVDFDAEFII